MLTSQQRDVQMLARDFAEGEIRPRAGEWDREGAFGKEVLAKLGELGFLGMRVPEKYGGLGFDLQTWLIALEEISRADAALALTVAIQSGPATSMLMEYGSETQREKWLPAMASGEKLLSFALSEDNAGSDPAALTTTARRNGEDSPASWTLSGSKRWVTNGALADAVFVFAQTGSALGEIPDRKGPECAGGASCNNLPEEEGQQIRPASERSSVGAFLVDTDATGYEVGRREKTMGLRASQTVAVCLNDVRIDENRLVGDPTRGLNYALGALDVGRMGVAAQASGIAHAAMGHAIRYAQEREQFGRKIATFGGIRAKLAVMGSRIAAAKALIMEGARGWERISQGQDDEGVSLTARAAMAKLVASETAVYVTDQTVNIFGGYGFMSEFPVEKLLRDAKGTEIYEGTSEVLRLIIGRAIAPQKGH